jgi:hypothetical protein
VNFIADIQAIIESQATVTGFSRNPIVLSLHRPSFHLVESLLFIWEIVKAFTRRIMNDGATIQFANDNYGFSSLSSVDIEG